MSDEIIIRHAESSDLGSFRELRLEALKNHPTAFGADYEETPTHPNEYWQERLKMNRNKEALFFAEHNGQLVGMTGIFCNLSKKSSHDSMIWGVYVRPEWRGQHLSERLIHSCLKWAKDQGLIIADLPLTARNQKLYATTAYITMNI
ncbi:MAG: GNAT family N-acetyltransferase [Anaerolineales bacterium]|nr:GNAT family N-acetyltransferase [Anaerolineales bacterium]